MLLEIIVENYNEIGDNTRLLHCSLAQGSLLFGIGEQADECTTSRGVSVYPPLDGPSSPISRQ